MLKLFFIFVKPAFAANTIRVPPGMPVIPTTLWYSTLPGIISLLLLIAFILAFIYLLLGGISWITAGGNKEALASARQKVTYAILGLIVVLLSFVILRTFSALFSIGSVGF